MSVKYDNRLAIEFDNWIKHVVNRDEEIRKLFFNIGHHVEDYNSCFDYIPFNCIPFGALVKKEFMYKDINGIPCLKKMNAKKSYYKSKYETLKFVSFGYFKYLHDNPEVIKNHIPVSIWPFRNIEEYRNFQQTYVERIYKANDSIQELVRIFYSEVFGINIREE